MDDSQQAQSMGINILAYALVAGGILLLITGAFLVYPFASSRLAGVAIRQASSPTPPRETVNAVAGQPVAPEATPTLTPARPEPTGGVPLTPVPTPARPTRIVIPSIQVDAPVVGVTWRRGEPNSGGALMWDVPDQRAAGWHETSAPLGMPGNTVLNGHNTTRGEVFRDLYRMAIGDGITVYAGDVPFTYTVTEVLILKEGGQPLDVRLENARYIEPTTDERLTLVTCHPYGSLVDRLVIVAMPTQAATSP